MRRPNTRTRGFTFIEILFAVMILGIGFIMVAAMFPAALRQTQVNVEQATYNTVVNTAQQIMLNTAYARDPVAVQGGQPNPPRYLDQLTNWVVRYPTSPFDYDPTVTTLPSSGFGRPIPYSFHDPRFTSGAYSSAIVAKGFYAGPTVYQQMFDLVRGNMILPDKRDYAWVPLWSRGMKYSPSAPAVDNYATPNAALNLIILPVRTRNKSEYDANVTTPTINSTAQSNPACDVAFDYANLDPQIVEIKYYPPASTSPANAPFGVVQLNALRQGDSYIRQTANMVPAAQNPLAEGAYVVISDSYGAIHASAPYSSYSAMYNGMIFKLGSEVANQSGSSGTSNGIYWSVAEVDNAPTEQPYNLDLKKIGANDFNADNILALVVGRQPDPADAYQQSATLRNTSQKIYLNRKGPTQEIGYFLSSVPIK